MKEALDGCRKWAHHFVHRGFGGTIRQDDAEEISASLVAAVACIKDVGGVPKRIADITGIDGRTVAKFGRRLEAGKLWDEGEVTYNLEELPMAALTAMGYIEFTGEVENLEPKTGAEISKPLLCQ